MSDQAAQDAIYICELEELEDPGSRGFSVVTRDGTVLDGFVVRQGRDAYAYVDSCPHTGAPLAWRPDCYLDIEGGHIECALHGALFTLNGGYCVRGPCAGRSLSPLAVELRGGSVLVRPQAEGG